jgi:DNA replication protein DnaC
MGHKGVSKRKPKKTKTFSSDNINGLPNARQNESSSVKSLVKDNETTPNKGVMNPAAGSNNKNRKGK